MFIAILGSLIVLFKQNAFRFFIVLLFFVPVTWVLSSWWAWNYAGAYGLRAYIDFYAVFALLLAVLISSLTSLWVKIPVILLVLLCVCLNIFQTSQYVNGIIPCGGMSQEQYWRVFLKNDPSYKYIFDYADTTNLHLIPNATYKNDFENNTWKNDNTLTTSYAHSGSHSVLLTEKNQYSPILELKASKIPKVTPPYIYIDLWAYMPDFNNNAGIVVSVQTQKN
jgi:hypothetical protein